MPLPLVRPMLATKAAAVPAGGDWTYEVKWDGYRTLAYKDGARVRLLSRNLGNATAQYPRIAKSIAQLSRYDLVIDGEIVALDPDGRPSFQALHHQSAQTLVYYAFDLLHLDGHNLMDFPLEQRRAELAAVVRDTPVLLSEPLPGTPAEIEKAVRALHLEGLVAKRRLSRYEPGRRSASWIKVKFNQRQEFVIGGFKPNAKNLESLVVGYYDGKKLLFAGRVRAGLTPRTRVEIFDQIEADRIARCPFANLPMSRTGHWGEGVTAEDMTKLQWVKPRLVVEVSFVEWTRDGALRHSEFLGVRNDKGAREVRRED